MFSIPFLVVLLSLLRITAGIAKTALTTRSWNCCKLSCSWPEVANVSSPLTAYSSSNSPSRVFEQPSSCDKPVDRGAYACADESPLQVDETTSYGFPAVQLAEEDRSAWSCACYKLTLTSGLIQDRAMVVQAVSMIFGIESDTCDLFVCIIHTSLVEGPID